MTVSLILMIGCAQEEAEGPQTPTPPTIADGDLDDDGVPDIDDNCPEAHNPGQQDLDGDGEGDDCDEDIDGDLIPDVADHFPTDPMLPGRASNESIYIPVSYTHLTLPTTPYV